MHLLNRRIHHYICLYDVIILEHDFHNQTPLLKIKKFNKKETNLLKFILDLMNVINIFAFHHVLMEYQLIYKSNFLIILFRY